MPRVEVNSVSEFERVAEKHLDQVIADLEELTFVIAQRGLTEAVRTAKRENIVDTGEYIRGFHVTDNARKRNDGFRDRRFKRRGCAILVNNVPHALNIEHGRRPGAPLPPEDAIKKWARRKFGIKAQGKGIRGQSKRDADLIRNIRWKIHHKGIKPKFVMLRVYRKMEAWYHAESRKILARR